MWWSGHKWSKEEALRRLGPPHKPKLEFNDQMVFPRLTALAEVAWSPKDKDWDNFKTRLREHIKRLDLLGVRKAGFTASLDEP